MKSNQLMELFGVSDIMDLPDAIMEVLLGDIDRRNDVYTRLLEMNGMDVSCSRKCMSLSWRNVRRKHSCSLLLK